jgi:hypothetical protein
MAKHLLDELQPELRAAADPDTRIHRLALATGSFAGAFVLAGFSEQWGLTQIIGLLLLSLLLRSRLIWLALAGAVCGYGVVAIAPGNAVRVAALQAVPPSRPFWEALEYSCLRAGEFIWKTALDKYYALLIAFCAGYLTGRDHHLRNRVKWLIGVAAGGYAFMAITLFPIELLSGNLEYRHYTIGTFMLVTCIAGIGYIFACQK